MESYSPANASNAISIRPEAKTIPIRPESRAIRPEVTRFSIGTTLAKTLGRSGLIDNTGGVESYSSADATNSIAIRSQTKSIAIGPESQPIAIGPKIAWLSISTALAIAAIAG